MFESIQFQNFKALRDATLKLRPFNLIVGPNGSGKSTVIQALAAVSRLQPNVWIANSDFDRFRTVGPKPSEIRVRLQWSGDLADRAKTASWAPGMASLGIADLRPGQPHGGAADIDAQSFISAIRVYALEPNAIAAAVQLQPNMELERNGRNLAGVLDRLRDSHEEVFDGLKAELRNWLPEFDNLVFETPGSGMRSIQLRQAFSKQVIASSDLSDGTLIALALLAIAYSPNPPSLVCLEEPDRGLHPRLLRDVRDALYRLSYPEQFKLARKPVQVIATTHSPYFVDLFKDHPEEIIVAEKNSDGTASFKSLAEDEKLRELIGEAPLGEVWYSGVLGGVPAAK